MEALDLSFGEKVLIRRKRLGLTVEEAADRCGLTGASISRYERGMASPTVEQLKKLADGLGLEPNYLLDWEDAEATRAKVDGMYPESSPPSDRILSSVP